MLLDDPNIPATPSVHFSGPAGFPAESLRFQASAVGDTKDFAAIKWRLAEVTPPNSSSGTARGRRCYEITSAWESSELAEFSQEVNIPTGVARAGHDYRVRARVKDATGRWSHWSGPVEFVAGK
jgi:hypothetical protein